MQTQNTLNWSPKNIGKVWKKYIIYSCLKNNRRRIEMDQAETEIEAKKLVELWQSQLTEKFKVWYE